MSSVAFTTSRQDAAPLSSKPRWDEGSDGQTKKLVIKISLFAIKLIVGIGATVASIAIIAGALAYLGLPAATVAATTAAIVAATIAVNVAAGFISGVVTGVQTVIKA